MRREDLPSAHIPSMEEVEELFSLKDAEINRAKSPRFLK